MRLALMLALAMVLVMPFRSEAVPPIDQFAGRWVMLKWMVKEGERTGSISKAEATEYRQQITTAENLPKDRAGSATKAAVIGKMNTELHAKDHAKKGPSNHKWYLGPVGAIFNVSIKKTQGNTFLIDVTGGDGNDVRYIELRPSAERGNSRGFDAIAYEASGSTKGIDIPPGHGTLSLALQPEVKEVVIHGWKNSVTKPVPW